MEKLREDIQGLEKRFVELSDVHQEDLTLHFTVGLLGGDYAASVLMPEEYPSGEPTNLEDFSMLKPGPIDDVINQVITRLRQRERSTMYTSGGSFGMDEDEDQTEDDDEFNQALDMGTGAAVGCYIDERDRQRALDRLEKDVSHFKKIYGANIGIHYVDATKSYLIRLAMPLDFLGKFQLSALYLDAAPRLVVELSWMWNYFEASEVPQIKNIYLTGTGDLDKGTIGEKDENFGVVEWYIRNRFGNALRLNWLTRREEIERSRSMGGKDKDGKGILIVKNVECESSCVGGSAPSGHTSNSPKPEDVQITPEQDAEITAKAKMIMTMGWSMSQALLALSQRGLKVEPASQFLGQTESIERRASAFTEEEWREKCYEVLRTQVISSFVAGGDAAGQFNDESNLRFKCKYENFFEDGCTNIINGMMRYLKYRMLIITKNCMICDKQLGFDGVKTAVCDAPTCSFALEQFGIGCNPLTELQRSGELVDIMISLSSAAVNGSASGTRDSFNPFCDCIDVPGPDPSFPTNFRLKEDAKNFALLKQVFEKMPNVNDMAACATKADLKKKLDEIHHLTFPLLQWVLASNRSHLMKIDKKLHLTGLGDYQYLLCASTPEKEERFRARREAMKQKNGGTGSFWAWHGSALPNWHAILRFGLKNYSNTSMMSAGAAYGPGIYLAKCIGTSVSYMREPVKGWNNSIITQGYNAIALCEVVDERKVKGSKCHDHGSIFVVEDEDLVCTRFFFIFPGGYTQGQSLDATTLEKPKALLDLF
eukprot:TRINITY_DN1517_c1_g2_i1.p1 TRINITY_DN1517_c1_g2~~TRINITY_DN1517_c1_g2_i1.p1  ORF type:complete len:782 (+),score=158.61 TRINITY_DN1517_c1_g2_i1:49-2346(+)